MDYTTSRFKKYIIAECFPIIFSPAITHADIANTLAFNILSAGFMWIEQQGEDNIHVHCWGASESLQIESNPERDKIIIQRFFQK